MKVVECPEIGPVTNLVVAERPDPDPAPGQVVLEVEAAGVNYVDALFVQGRYQIKPPVPFVPGSDVAGAVVAVGEGVTTPVVGDRVMVMCGLGGFAERVAVPAAGCVAVPDVLDASRAAAFTQSFCTARFALEHRAHLGAGETVLVLGAGGGVGQATVAVARAAGAGVVAVASTTAKRLAALDMGAEVVFDPAGRLAGPDGVIADIDDAADVDEAKRLVHALREWSGGGVDVAFDPVGGPLAMVALRALGTFGRLCVIGFASGEIPELPANQVLLRNRSVLGVDWGAWSLADPDAQRELLEGLLADVAAGRFAPAAPDVRPLAQAADALGDLLSRRVTGKVVLIP